MTDRVCDFADVETGLVQNGQNTFVGQLHQVADDLVVEVVHLQNMPHKMSKGVMQEHIGELVPPKKYKYSGAIPSQHLYTKVKFF